MQEEEKKYFVSPQEVVRIFKEYEMSKKDTKNPRVDKQTMQKRPKSHEGLPLMERCKLILAKRMTEKRGVGYLLDNVPVSCERLIKEAGLFLLD